MNVNLRQVRAFVEVYRMGSLTRAAQNLCVTQAAVSLLLKQMEDALGVRLFDRTTRRLTPTPAAVAALPVAQEMLGCVERLANGARSMRERTHGRFSFAVATSAAASLMPSLLAAHAERHPHVQAVMHDRPPERLLECVLMDEVEFAIGTPDRRTAALELLPLIEDRMCMICRRDAPQARRRSISWRALQSLPTISGSRRNSIRAIIDDTLAAHGLHFEPTREADFVPTALALTLQGLGVAILPPYLVGEVYREALCAVPVAEPVVPRTLYAIVKKGHELSPPAREFLDRMRVQWQDRRRTRENPRVPERAVV